MRLGILATLAALAWYLCRHLECASLQCLLYGHGWMETNDDGCKRLECYACGKKSVGWQIARRGTNG